MIASASRDVPRRRHTIGAMRRRWGLCVAVLAAGAALAGCAGSTTTTVVRTGSANEPVSSHPSGLAQLPTVKCKTLEGVARPAVQLDPTTSVAIPASLAEGLSAYRDTAGTMVVAPAGFDCEAGIGVDGSEHVTAFPKGGLNPAEHPSSSGPVVTLNIARACQGCIAEAVCTLFPKAKPVSYYYGGVSGEKCPEKPLREEVSYVSESTAMFSDPANVSGTGVGSGGEDPSLGAISYFESLGVRKLSCTLPADESEVCAAVVGATFAAVPQG